MTKLKHLWSNLRASFWFLPALIVAFSTVLATGLIEVDSSGSQDWMADWPRLFGAGAAGARGSKGPECSPVSFRSLPGEPAETDAALNLEFSCADRSN